MIIIFFEIKGTFGRQRMLSPRQASNQSEAVTTNHTTNPNITTDAKNSVDDSQTSPWSITKPGYDIRQPPHDPITGRPVRVHMTAFADFIETVNEQDGEMVMALFLRARWNDSRVKELPEILRGMPGYRKDMLPMSGDVKQYLWVPDLYLPMARRVTIPTIHEPAESITLYEKGIIAYSAFFVVALKCEMTYSDYPMDVQSCYLDVMSYKYSLAEMELQWHPDSFVASLQGHTKIVTKHFLVTIIIPKVNSSFIVENADGSKRHVIRLQIFMKRHLAFHVVQTYVPSALLVMVGWLSLLVPLDFAYGRMVLSVTTLLVLVSIFVTNSQMAPGVNEVKALDVWLFMCIVFVFSAIVDCIADLRFLSMVEKESQIAGEERSEAELPPALGQRAQPASQTDQQPSALSAGDSNAHIQFQGSNTPFQADREVLIATPAVLKWLRMAVFLERSMSIVYPTLFMLMVAIYWSIYLTSYHSRTPESVT